MSRNEAKALRTAALSLTRSHLSQSVAFLALVASVLYALCAGSPVALASTSAINAAAGGNHVTPVTLADLESAYVPSLRGNPSGHLVNGVLPDPSGMGSVELATPSNGSPAFAFGDLTGDGVNDAAVVVDSASGAGGGTKTVELYTGSTKRLGTKWLGEFAPDVYNPPDSSTSITHLSISKQNVYVKWVTMSLTAPTPKRHSVKITFSGGKIHVSGATPYPTSTAPNNYVVPVSARWDSPDLTITPNSLGAVKVGMTLTQAERAAGLMFAAMGDGAYDAVGAAGLGISMGNRVQSVCARYLPGAPKIRTANGFVLGQSLKVARERYGSKLKFIPAPTGGMIPSPGYVVQSDSGNLVFMVQRGKVYEVASGVGMLPSYIGC